MLDLIFDVLMALLALVGLLLPIFGIQWANLILAAPAGAYLGVVIHRITSKNYYF